MSIQFLDTCGIACTFENVVEITVYSWVASDICNGRRQNLEC